MSDRWAGCTLVRPANMTETDAQDSLRLGEPVIARSCPGERSRSCDVVPAAVGATNEDAALVKGRSPVLSADEWNRAVRSTHVTRKEMGLPLDKWRARDAERSSGVGHAAAVRNSAGCTKLELRIGPNWMDAAAPFLDARELRSGFHGTHSAGRRCAR